MATATLANVLIVDDDRDLSAAIADVIESEGHTARTAHHGREGLARVYELRPDVILLDVEMPVLDGPAMVRRLRALEPDGGSIPFVLLSGLPQLEKIAETLDTPYFISKPFSIDRLLQTVATALEQPWKPERDPRP